MLAGGTPGSFKYSGTSGNTFSGAALTGPTFSVLSGGALSGRPFTCWFSCCSGSNPATEINTFTVDVTGSYTITSAWSGFDGYLLLYY